MTDKFAEKLDRDYGQSPEPDGGQIAVSLEADDGSWEPQEIIQVTRSVSPTDILGWLRHSNQAPKTYWRSRDKQFEFGGIGATIRIVARDPGGARAAFQRIEAILDQNKGDSFLGFVGGSRFGAVPETDPSWQQFPRLWYVMPETFVFREGDDHYVSKTVRVDNGVSREGLREELLDALGQMQLDPHNGASPTPMGIGSRRDSPGYAAWQNNVFTALSEIERERLEKVVLARKTDLTIQGGTDWAQLLERLKHRSENSFIFCFQPTGGAAFLGATPERLFKMQARTLISEAVSGTMSRLPTLDEDLESGINLLHSDKNLREHQFVVDAIKRIKNNLCQEIHTHPKPSLLKLSNVQHLYTRITGELRQGVTVHDLLSTLHPTPAVGGTPRRAALSLIEKLEDFDRGWYAGPVGVLSREWSEMVVALRSMLVSGDRAEIFAGAGIVNGSTPESEWRELESKISIALEAFDESPS